MHSRHGGNLLNLSLGYFGGNTSGVSKLSLMADYITYALRVPMTISAGNAGTSIIHLPQGPGDAYNVFSLASTSKTSNWSQIVSDSSLDQRPMGTINRTFPPQAIRLLPRPSTAARLIPGLEPDFCCSQRRGNFGRRDRLWSVARRFDLIPWS